MVVPISDPIHYAPVTRPYRRWLALSAALLLHLLLIGVVASWQFALPPAERTSLDVVLVTRPAEAPVQADAIAEADQQAAGEQSEAAPAERRAAPLEGQPASEAADSTVMPPAAEPLAEAPEPPSRCPNPQMIGPNPPPAPPSPPHLCPCLRPQASRLRPPRRRCRAATCWPRPPAAYASRASTQAWRGRPTTSPALPPSLPPRRATSTTGRDGSRTTATGCIPLRRTCTASCASAW
ncbi:hypothetical protein [Halomonas sp. E19]|uniref:hypothetical protein n=1 Tax=Halomonas sp. E19 TaxID=3397247 RepID=UPI0040332D1B